MIEIFEREEFFDFKRAYEATVKESIAKTEDAEIENYDINELNEYYFNMFELQKILLYEDDIFKEASKCVVEQYNPMFDFLGGRKTIEQPGIRMNYIIPFDGDCRLLHISPSHRYMCRFYVDALTPPSDKECGYIKIHNDFTDMELKNQKENMQSYVGKEFNHVFNEIKNMINYVNDDVNTINISLKRTIQDALELRKDKLSDFNYITSMLDISINNTQNKKVQKPIILRKIVKKQIRRLNSSPTDIEYGIKDSDYYDINNVIYNCCSSMETQVDTYAIHNEEELRNFLLATLNTHYSNATGETFRKSGKTDIHIPFDNRTAFVGECKIWHGDKMFENAINQLLNYTTWKDFKVSLIIFNKDNSDFNNIIDSIDNWANTHSTDINKKHKNIWTMKYFYKERNTNIKLTILLFDLFSNKKTSN